MKMINAVLTLKAAGNSDGNQQAGSTKPDVASLELFTNRFRGIADEMGAFVAKNGIFGKYQRAAGFFLRLARPSW